MFCHSSKRVQVSCRWALKTLQTTAGTLEWCLLAARNDKSRRFQFVLQWTPVQTILEKSDWCDVLELRMCHLSRISESGQAGTQKDFDIWFKTKANELAEA